MQLVVLNRSRNQFLWSGFSEDIKLEKEGIEIKKTKELIPYSKIGQIRHPSGGYNSLFWDYEGLSNLKDLIVKLKLIAIFEFERTGFTGKISYFYRKKMFVIYWNLDLMTGFQKEFWDLWNEEKDFLKSIGFGITREVFGIDEDWIIFCQIDFMIKWKEFRQLYPKYLEIYEKFKKINSNGDYYDDM